MKQSIEQILYIDPQAKRPDGFCPCCGGALWLPSLRCIRCGKEDVHDPA